jgi:hypothetical protein
MHIEKKKLAKGLSYPLHPAVLEGALSTLGVAAKANLMQGGGAALFECFFWPPNPNAPYERLYIRTAAVPGGRANAARSLIEDSVLPEFCAWLQDILDLSPNSTVRREEQYFVRSLP